MTNLNPDIARFNMVEQQVRPWDVLDPQVLNIMGSLPRERFVEPAYQAMAYADTDLPLADGQLQWKPTLAGRVLQALALQNNERVLEIGTGSAYLTACLARLAGQVDSVEIIESLSRRAQESLQALDIKNVTLHCGNGLDMQHEAFDVIVLTGSCPLMPQTLKQNLTVGGRLFVIVGDAPAMRAMLVTRVSEDHWSEESLFETVVPALVSAPEPSRFSL